MELFSYLIALLKEWVGWMSGAVSIALYLCVQWIKNNKPFRVGSLASLGCGCMQASSSSPSAPSGFGSLNMSNHSR
jgi:hypothetical protein